MKDLSKRAKEIIANIEYITLASVTPEGLPWNSPVFVAYDESYTFYFGTHKDSQKALNITRNPNVFLVMYDSTAAAGSGEGVYIKGHAQALSSTEEISKAHELLWNRHSVPYWTLEQLGAGSPIQLYRIVPEKAWMNDEGAIGGIYIDTRTEITL